MLILVYMDKCKTSLINIYVKAIMISTFMLIHVNT